MTGMATLRKQRQGSGKLWATLKQQQCSRRGRRGKVKNQGGKLTCAKKEGYFQFREKRKQRPTGQIVRAIWDRWVEGIFFHSFKPVGLGGKVICCEEGDGSYLQIHLFQELYFRDICLESLWPCLRWQFETGN